MAKETDVKLRNQSIYSIYVRNHSKEGNFKGVIKDLDRIQKLGVEMIWLLPIHPIGQVNKKGSLGCIYSIQDYREINSEYGTLQDFKELLGECHKRDMKVLIDVVYNHTAHESTLYKEKLEWFYRKENGELGNKAGEWTDVIDLDYEHKELWQYQIETLKYWVQVGVDGFRCDVASMVPIEFWREARREVSKVKSGVIWIAETVGPDFIQYLRSNNINAHSDSEMYEAFDITYDYDTFPYFKQYLDGEIVLEDLLEKKRSQEYIYPANYIKLRFLENHDQPRASFRIQQREALMNWTAFMFFERGTALLYAGQEVCDKNQPSLFDVDLVNWSEEEEFTSYIKELIQIKKKQIFAYGNYSIKKASENGVIEASYEYKDKKIIGIFNVEGKNGEYKIDIKDGSYNNLIYNKKIEVQHGNLSLGKEAMIFEI